MILSQQPSLFLSTRNNEFHVLLQNKACPLVANFLLSECSVEDQEESRNLAVAVTIPHLTRTILLHFSDVETLAGECHILVMSLICFVSNAMESYRDSDSFEDGYIYTSDSLSREQSVTHKNHLISNPLLWRAALALECIYSLTSDPEKVHVYMWCSPILLFLCTAMTFYQNIKVNL